MSDMNQVPVDETYIADLERSNAALYAEVNRLKIENAGLRKDVEVLVYTSTVNSAQVDIYRARLVEMGSDPNEI